jgi:ribosomal protein S18 acetylase RimI-like enzyme
MFERPTIEGASPPITIRRAMEADLARMAAILYHDPPTEMRGVVPDLVKTRKIGALLLRYRLEADVERTQLAVIDGEPVGLLESMRPRDHSNISPMTIGAVLARGMLIVGPQGLVRYVRYQSARARVQVERTPGSYYIAELDVHPDHRNRGIGASLLRHAEREARDEGFSQMSLATSIINPAQHLYMREGYRVMETRRDGRYEQITGIPGRVLMVKDLA